MTVTQTVLVFIGIPLGIIGVIFIAVYGKSMVRQPNRYRPGRPWDYDASWYVPHPDAVVHPVTPSQRQPESAATTAVGGASSEW